VAQRTGPKIAATFVEIPMNTSRRTVLKSLGGAGASLALGAGLLQSAQAQTLSPITVALSWVPNVEYAGLWLAAENGYFREEGLDMKFLPGGPNAPLAPVSVAAGRAEIGYATWLPFLDAVQKGNDFVAIGATFPVSPVGVLSLPKKRIRTARDLNGPRILVPGPNERAAVEATLKLNKLPVAYTPVPAGFSPEALLEGAGDGYVGYATNQVITFEKQGLVRDKDFFFTSLDSLGFKAAAALLFTTRKNLEANRPRVVAFMRALVRGWQDNERESLAGARLAAEKYGRDLGLELRQQTAQALAQNRLLHDPAAPALPVMALSEKSVAGGMYATAMAAGRSNLPDVKRLFDFDVVREAAAGIKRK
jgi:ABC-type nitrate/sulfonate/bicarbonate transport system substrate-binding protein